MKKVFALLLAVTLVFAAGCSNKTEQPAPTAAPTVPETTTPPETTVPETEPPMPKLEAGVVQGEHIPAILCQLKKGDLVEVTGYASDGSATVKIGDGVGTVEKELLCFAGDGPYESWTAYARYNTPLYKDYKLTGEAEKKLKTNTELTILDELESCYLVKAGEDTGYIAKKQASKWRITSKPKTDDGSSSGGGGGSSGGSSGGSGSSGGQDGGDIHMAFYPQLQLLSDVVKTGSAEIRADGGVVVLKYFGSGDTVQIVAEKGFAPELPGYTTILEDGVYAYVPTAWVRKSGDEEFKQWDGFAGYSCYLYDNYELRGEPVKQIYANKAITVLWQAGDVTLIRVGDDVGYISTATARTTRIPTQKKQEDGGGSSDGSSGGGGGGGGGSEWTPPAM